MTQFNWKLNFLIVFVINSSRASLIPGERNVCLRDKAYQETVMVHEIQTQYYKETEWCFSVSNFFRCEVTKSNDYLVKVPRVFNRVKKVPECCDGYQEDTRTKSFCVPVCSGECIHGECISPEICACDSGFYGANCQTPCPPGRWGRNCSEICDCLNGAKCGRVNGNCTCRPGWQGYRCEYPCPEGYHGHLCEERCKCKGQPCDHITGTCIIATTEMTTSTTTEIATTETETNFPFNSARDDHETTEVESENATNPQIFITPPEPTEETTLKEIIFQKKTYDEVENAFNPSDVLFATFQTETIYLSTSTESQQPGDYLTDNLAINETDDNFDGEHADFNKFQFVPSLTLVSGVSVLIFIIAARWVIVKYRTKANRMEKQKEDIVFEERKFCQRDNTFFNNYITENTIYLSDLEINKSAPTLQTFKPLKKGCGEDL